MLISSEDLVIAISRGGETAEVNHVLKIAKERGTKIIGIMEAMDSTMGSYCVVALHAKVSQANNAGGLIPLASTMVQAAIGDILSAGLSEVKGLPDDKFGQHHPGGAVGKRLSKSQANDETGTPRLDPPTETPLSTIKGLILDMDGVLWHGNDPMEGLKPFFDLLNEKGIRYVMATNNPSKHPAGFAEKARNFGIKIDSEDVLSSVVATAHYLKNHFPQGTREHVIGESALKEGIAEAGYELADEDVEVVVAALERSLTYVTIKSGSLLIRTGATLLGTNADPSYPTDEGFVP